MFPRRQYVRACDALWVWVALFVYGLNLEYLVVFVNVCKPYDLRV
jgi:hypothetical protein